MKNDKTISLLGRAIKAKRKRLNLRLDAVAEKTGISSSTISRIENGYGCDSETMTVLAGWLDVPIDRLFESEENPTEAVIYFPTEPLPDIIEAHLLKDKTLTKQHAAALAEMFRAAYNQFVDFKKK